MRLSISKSDGQFVVDDLSLPGSPAVGRGRTMKEAIGDFVHANQLRLGVAFDVDASAKAAELRRRSREMGKR
jgi:hypothetical protein